jgi:hypothetical protein
MCNRKKICCAAVVLCAALAAWVGYDRWFAPRSATFRGKTAAAWDAELRHWSPDIEWVSIGGRGTHWGYHAPAYEVWLAQAGFSVRSSDSDLALLAGDPDAVPVLLELLKSSSPKTRRVAAQGLGQVGSWPGLFSPESREESATALLRAIDDDDPDVRLEAEQALVRVDREAAERAGLEWLQYGVFRRSRDEPSVPVPSGVVIP